MSDRTNNLVTLHLIIGKQRISQQYIKLT